MGQTNYCLNLDNVIDTLGNTNEGLYIHERMGIDDERADEIADYAYKIVGDNVDDEHMISAIHAIKELYSKAKEKDYNDVELTYFLYWGFSEIDARISPSFNISVEDAGTGDIFIN